MDHNTIDTTAVATGTKTAVLGWLTGSFFSVYSYLGDPTFNTALSSISFAISAIAGLTVIYRFFHPDKKTLKKNKDTKQ